MSRTQTIIFAPNLLLLMAIKAVKIGFFNVLLFMTSYDLADTLGVKGRGHLHTNVQDKKVWHVFFLLIRVFRVIKNAD